MQLFEAQPNGIADAVRNLTSISTIRIIYVKRYRLKEGSNAFVLFLTRYVCFIFVFFIVLNEWYGDADTFGPRFEISMHIPSMDYMKCGTFLDLIVSAPPKNSVQIDGYFVRMLMVIGLPGCK